MLPTFNAGDLFRIVSEGGPDSRMSLITSVGLRRHRFHLFRILVNEHSWSQYVPQQAHRGRTLEWCAYSFFRVFSRAHDRNEKPRVKNCDASKRKRCNEQISSQLRDICSRDYRLQRRCLCQFLMHTGQTHNNDCFSGKVKGDDGVVKGHNRRVEVLQFCKSYASNEKCLCQ